ncbi:hypothetical protein BGW36DRAFT_359478 [Talaromyces proteolyticus]|uniref:ferroxidase n=1 Tax=Talaromyces proteolyticus TaxID=1131652 RepID=A0AAD4Q0K9_9EURO|nr:uncharacterized protein BGW36DRAFT_359478 [Talaromyces proteolyticus]KAH8697697.1 hypothetical protein BGW36DRAFT_359478 [Talaromyces proteolyticus]
MLARTSRALLPSIRRSVAPASIIRPAATLQQEPQWAQSQNIQQQSVRRSLLHTTPTLRKGLLPESSDPKAPNPESSNAAVAAGATHVAEATPLSDRDYHEVSEHYLNVLLAEVERVQEEGSDMEAEYSAGVLNVIVPSVGTYVLNKQPPNHQIWLSSPISGPKRYDWVVQGDQMHEKQDTRDFIKGQWIYLRDGSNLTNLLNDELTLELPEDIYSEQ